MAHTTIPDELTPFFRGKRFEATFTSGALHYTLHVETPDLFQSEVTVWADWGPMYSCTLPLEQVVTITYHCAETNRRARYEFHPPTVKLHSPARWTQRAEQPLTLEVADVARSLKIIAHLGLDGEVVATNVLPLSVDIDVNELVFCAIDHTPRAVSLDPAHL